MDAHAGLERATFGQFLIDFGKRSLHQIDESGVLTPIALGSRAFDILALLVAHAGELVSKTDIIRSVWPGLAVEEANLSVQVSALRRALGQQGLGHIQTVQGRGYRFVAEVIRDVAIPHDDLQAAPVAEFTVLSHIDRPRAWYYRRRTILIAVVVLFVGVGVADVLTHVFHRAPPPRLSIAVLPFSIEPEAQSLAGFSVRLSESLTTDLNQFWGMSVSAPQAVSRFKDRGFDARSVGQALNVRYLVEGSLHAANERFILHLDLVSTESGKDLWSDQTDWPLSDAVAAQPHTSAWLQNAVGNGVLKLEASRSAQEHPDDPDATDLYLQGQALLLLPSKPDRLHAARDLLERAVQKDPNAYLAKARLLAAIINSETDLDEIVTEHDLRYGEQLLAQAEAIAPMAPAVLGARAYLLRLEQRWPEAEAAFEHLLSLYPHHYYAAFLLAICRLHTGRAAEAIPLFQDAVETSAGMGDLFARYVRLGEALLFAGHYDEAVPWFRKAEIADPGRTPSSQALPYWFAASALALGGHIDVAHAEMAHAISIYPYMSSRSFWDGEIGADAYAIQLDRVRQGLAQSGLQPFVSEDAPGAPSQPADLPSQLAGLTPRDVLGGKVISTAALTKLLRDTNAVVLDGEIGRNSIPGAVVLRRVSHGGAVTDDMQPAFAQLLAELTAGDKARPIVTLSLNAYRWEGYNLARRAVALGYSNVFWYRGGRDAWAAAGLPMEKLRQAASNLFSELH